MGRDDAFDVQIRDSRPIFPVTLEDGFIQSQRKLCSRSQRFTRIQATLENLGELLQDFIQFFLKGAGQIKRVQTKSWQILLTFIFSITRRSRSDVGH